jgi:peptide/nickel transport system substrate-binding protein
VVQARPQGLSDRLHFYSGRVDDPDQQFYENYACGSERNYSGYCNREIEKLFDQESMESNQEKRKQLVW